MTAPVAPGDAALPPGLLVRSRHGMSPVLVLAFFGAAVLHIFLALGVSFEMPTPDTEMTPESALQVLILKDTGVSTDKPADDAVLSQVSRVGESPQGNAGLTREPDVELEGPEDAPDVPPPLPPPPEQVVEGDSQPEPTPAPESTPPEPDLQTLTVDRPSPVSAAEILASRNREIERLTASLEARSAAYAQRQRRRSISASTREFRYANYLAAWASKVERIGNLNYPQAAKDQHIYGNLILHVAIRRDGSVEQIRVVRSSGYDVLDDAAIRIVELAAPYAPFPPDIAAETDVLDIIRTWQFEHGGHLGWDQ